jgi:hypothetical protein
MPIQPTSFLLGLGAAWLLPVVGRALRPLAVQVTAAGMGMYEEALRVIAEQVEALEDLTAEARALREERALEDFGGADAAPGGGEDQATEPDEAPRRGRRRGDGGSRRRPS